MSRLTAFEGIKSRDVFEYPERSFFFERASVLAMRNPPAFSEDELDALGIIHPGMHEQAVLNAFRQLRTSLLTKLGKINSCIMVTGDKSGVGTSFSALNLAAAFTFDHQKTALLVDCNFSNPALAKRLNHNPQFGLKDFIVGNVSEVSSIIYPTGIPRLRLVPSGNSKSDVVEFFTGTRMHDFLGEVRERYPDRVIIVDAPPILESADAQILAELCDHVLLVLKYKACAPSSVDRCLSIINRAKFLGMVINN